MALSTFFARAVCVMTVAAALFSASAARAAGDHGSAAPAAAATSTPRLSAHSELFELVGVVEKDQMTLFLDRYATNEPVTGARIEYEAGSTQGLATAQADGTYVVKSPALLKPGELALSFTVTAGTESDLLTAPLVVPKAHDDHAESSERHWPRNAAYAVAALMAIAIASFAARRLRRADSPSHA